MRNSWIIHVGVLSRLNINWLQAKRYKKIVSRFMLVNNFFE